MLPNAAAASKTILHSTSEALLHFLLGLPKLSFHKILPGCNIFEESLMILSASDTISAFINFVNQFHHIRLYDWARFLFQYSHQIEIYLPSASSQSVGGAMMLK